MYAELSPDQLAAGMVRVVWDHGPAHVELTAPGRLRSGSSCTTTPA